MRIRQQGAIHISSGGILYRVQEGQLEFLLLRRKEGDTWHLPKGTLQEGENARDAAIREVLEETGYVVAIDAFIGILPSSFVKDCHRVEKLTLYYLMHPVSANALRHDHEHDEIGWIEAARSIDLLQQTANKLQDIEQEYLIAIVAQRVVAANLLPLLHCTKKAG